MNDEITFNEEHNEGMPEKGKIVSETGMGYTLNVDRKDLFKAASGLKEAGFDLFQFVTGVDYPDTIKLTYRIFSTKRQNKVAVFLKTEVPKSDPTVDSLVPVWSAANWHERETYDLLGVNFIGHPDLCRIFMPQDWVGHPLRKDYSDDRIIVMDDGKKEKPAGAAKDKPASASKDKPVATKDNADSSMEEEQQASEQGAAKPEGTSSSATGTTEVTTAEPTVTEPAIVEPAMAKDDTTEDEKPADVPENGGSEDSDS